MLRSLLLYFLLSSLCSDRHEKCVFYIFTSTNWCDSFKIGVLTTTSEIFEHSESMISVFILQNVEGVFRDQLILYLISLHLVDQHQILNRLKYVRLFNGRSRKAEVIAFKFIKVLEVVAHRFILKMV